MVPTQKWRGVPAIAAFFLSGATLVKATPLDQHGAALSVATPTPIVLIPLTSFDSQTDFDKYWDYNYPWGTDHNGAARMNRSQVSLSPPPSSSGTSSNSSGSGTLTLTATRVAGQPAATHANQAIAIHYLSGTVHARHNVVVKSPGGIVEVAGEYKAPVARGTWPASWLTWAGGWPPEVDLAEWKGSGKISFNTFNTSSAVAALDVAYPDPERWHSVRVVMEDENGRDVAARFFLDGRLATTQYGKGFTGKEMYLILDLQMEGSSGSPGPQGETTFRIRNFQVTSTIP
ncbi:hypothetical protein VTK73DRAFT_9178 [Phialemonium thermophilum]|uniref:GH16 domain-containing protein n=1 Tax=Phialemonium thermophilum TaxID=223376 RepID=A0ABR3W3W1_9PEZI